MVANGGKKATTVLTVVALVITLLLPAHAIAYQSGSQLGDQLQVQVMNMEQVQMRLQEMKGELEGFREQLREQLQEQDRLMLEQGIVLLDRVIYADRFTLTQMNQWAGEIAQAVPLEDTDDPAHREAVAHMLQLQARLHELAGDHAAAHRVYIQAIERNRLRHELYEELGQVRAQLGEEGVTAFVNGRQPEFDVPPFIREGRTLVPVRAITEALGAEVGWDGETRTVTITRGDIVIVIRIDDATVTVNGEEFELDVPATIKNDRTVVPVRFVSEAFGCNVDWVPQGRVVIVNDATE